MTARLPIIFAAAALGLASIALPAAAIAQDAPAGPPPDQGAGCGPYGTGGSDGLGPMRHFQITPEDRAAFLNARLAAVRAGLGLSADQQKLWPPVETAIREAVRQLGEARQKMRAEFKGGEDGGMANPIDRLVHIADIEQLRATMLRQIADAGRPLYESLNEDQKRRLHILMHVMHEHGGPMMFMGHHGWDG